MADELKKVELDLEELDKVAGGAAAGEPVQWKCVFCGKMITIHSNTEAAQHASACEWNPKNRR